VPRPPERVAALAALLRAGGNAGPAVARGASARPRPPLPEALSARFVPSRSDRTIPAPVRVVAAARLLRDLPDKADAVRGVVKSITVGLSPLRALERLRHLQHQVEKGRVLDVLIERREQRVKMDCPRCGVRLPRVEMVKHLWHAHRLFLDRGKVRDPDRLAEDRRAEFAATGDPSALDWAVLLARPGGAGTLRAWGATSNPPAEDTAPLRAAAQDRHPRLCPRCLAPVPPPVPPPPPPPP